MDAVEYVKALRRLCISQSGCNACQLNGKNGCIVSNMDKESEKAVPIVEQWSKDHPVKTRQSEFLKMFPNATIDEDDGILCIRPCYVEEDIGCTDGRSCDGCRRKFWLTEVTDND